MPVIDLFCGCGGLSKGFEMAGFEISAAFDGWQSAVACYNANFNHDAILLDLNDVNEAVKRIAPFNATVIIGGPPCQEFSNAGTRKEGSRANLTLRFAEIVTKITPRCFVMENVPQVYKSKVYASARTLYKQNGYGLTEVVLDASKCGVPQKRKRFFCIGILGEKDNFLLDSIFNAQIEQPVSVAQYFANQHIPLDIDAYYRHPTTYTRRAIFSVQEVAPTIRGVNRPRPSTYQHHPQDAVEEDAMNNVNRLSLRQRAHIQSFPADFVFENLGIAHGELEQMIGNAVPVLLAQFVAERLHNYIMHEGSEKRVQERQAFSEWLRLEKHYSDRSISDVFSRLNRAAGILPNHEMNRYYIVDLENAAQYAELSTSVKSQIRKAINLKLTFLQQQANENK